MKRENQFWIKNKGGRDLEKKSKSSLITLLK